MINIRKILFIGLSNIGDAVLTLPALDYLIYQFPEAYIVVLSGPRPQEIFEDRKVVNELIVFDKYAPVIEKIKLIGTLRHKKFDAVVDMRNTAFPLFINYKIRTPFTQPPREIAHMKNRHFWRVKKMFKINKAFVPKRHFLIPSTQDKSYVNELLPTQQHNVVISAGARSQAKRWPTEGFIDVARRLRQDLKKNVILVGDAQDKEITSHIVRETKMNILDLAGKLSLRQLSYLISKSDFVLTNDSAVLHISSYINKPTVALFGPTDFKKYGPWSSRNAVVYKGANIEAIKPTDVLKACVEIMK